MMTFDDRAADRQPDAHSANLCGIKRLEEPLEALWIETHPRVLHGDPYTITFLLSGPDHQPTWAVVNIFHRVGGIQNQIQDDLLELNTIASDRREPIGKFQDNLAFLQLVPR